MTTRCRAFILGGPVAAGYGREPKIRDTRITLGVHENILLSLGEHRAERKNANETPTGFKSPWITPREWR